MSLKAIELQVAIPRTQNLGKIQDQLQQRGQVVQDLLAGESQKADEKKRKQVIETQEAEKKRLNNDDENHNNRNRSNNGKQDVQQPAKNSNQETVYAKHPYKGNFVDFSG